MMTISRIPETETRPRGERGSALMLVIASILLISIAVVGLIRVTSASQEEHVDDALGFQARLLAESGVAIALHPDVEPGDPVLMGEMGENRTYFVRMTGEGGRFPVNNLYTDEYIAMLVDLFQHWGVASDDAAIAADSLADWIDLDGETRPDGAEATFYEGLGYSDRPRDETFSTIDEFLLVRGMGAVDRANPQWRDHLTLWGDGLIDVNSASPEVLAAAMGITVDQAERIVSLRYGGDGLPDTEDDVAFESLDDVQANSGLQGGDWEEVSPFLTVENDYRRIESTGVVGGVRRTIIVTTQTSLDDSVSYLALFER